MLRTRFRCDVVIPNIGYAMRSPPFWGRVCRCQQDKFWILDSTPYYMKEAVRLTQADMEVTEVRCVP